MNSAIVWIMIKKELRQVFRNKRVIIGLLLPLVLYPILFNVYMGVMEDTEKASAQEVSQVVLLSKLPVGLAADLVSDERLKVTDDAENATEKLRTRPMI